MTTDCNYYTRHNAAQKAAGLGQLGYGPDLLEATVLPQPSHFTFLHFDFPVCENECAVVYF